MALSSNISSALNKKICELWSTNHEVVFAYFDLPKINNARVFKQLQTLIAHILGMG